MSEACLVWDVHRHWLGLGRQDHGHSVTILHGCSLTTALGNPVFSAMYLVGDETAQEGIPGGKGAG